MVVAIVVVLVVVAWVIDSGSGDTEQLKPIPKRLNK